MTETTTIWCLTGRVESTGPVQVFEVASTPFSIGRQPGLSLILQSRMVSAVHAELTEEDGRLYVRDLGSTNGTYVNGKPVPERHELHSGDLVQVANVAFRLSESSPARDCHTQAGDSQNQAVSLVQFDRLLSERAVIPHYQPIVALPSKETVGYEALGRSRLFGLQSPKDMFLAASQLNLEEELSRILRCAGFEKGMSLSTTLTLYLNTHPAEIVTFGLLDSLKELRQINPDQQVALEVHEAAVTDLQTMQMLRDELTELNMQLVFDDFGAGQSRLVELTQVAPDVVKFDMHLIRDIHQCSPSQRQMLSSLVRMVRELGIIALAEGVETEGEHDVCCEVGFELAQGYYYGKPESLTSTLRNTDRENVTF